MTKLFILAIGCLALALAGCTSTNISRVGDSFTVIRKSFGTRHKIGELRIEVRTNDEHTILFYMRGYQNDQTEAIAAAVGAAVSAAKQ